MPTMADAPAPAFSPPPVPWSSFVGREQLVETVCSILQSGDTRLTTLIGPGGVGKTRLAIKVAGEIADDFADGVVFVDLTPVTDSTLVALTIAASLAIVEPGEQVVERIVEMVQNRDLLLILDNFEQVSEAAPLVAQMLSGSMQLKALVTSREPLHLTAER